MFFSDTPSSKNEASVSFEDNPIADSSNHFLEDASLEGILKLRKGKASGHGSMRWKERLVRLDFAGGGSIHVFEKKNSHNGKLGGAKQQTQTHGNLSIIIPSDLPWIAYDLANTTSTFSIEIPTTEQSGPYGYQNGNGFSSPQRNLNDSAGEISLDPSSLLGDDNENDDNDDDDEMVAFDELSNEMATAKRKGKPVRIYFRCPKGGNEKAHWLEAFESIDRLSLTHRKMRGIRGSLSDRGGKLIHPHHGRARKRKDDGTGQLGSVELFDEEFDESANDLDARINQMCFGKPLKRNEDKEYKVIPSYAYPHRWMTIKELHEEMCLPSLKFHDLRDPKQKAGEIGSLRVEVLQCIGIPRLDHLSDSDPVVYLVCGPRAFATDVIADRTNPMWLRRTKRACIFPLFHGYARLFVGVFDDDGERAKDDFAGRVVIDIARLRHNSQYDVTLPLRLSTHVYTRRPRGAVRLRFTLEWNNEKDVLLSYIPKKFKIRTPARSKPDLSTTITCADAKAFRNIAMTVHGVDMPSRFTFQKIKSALKEMSFTLRYLIRSVRQEIKDTKAWTNPTISAYIFVAWMHCIYEDSFKYVPGYVVLYIWLQFVRTYALFAVERSRKEGFLQPTIEEMVGSLVRSRSSTSVEPLEMYRKSGKLSSSFSVGTSYHGEVNPDVMITKTHEPKFRWLFKLLGFIPWRGDIWDDRNLHLEFPFADGNAYEKFTLKDCLADIGDMEDDHEEEEEEIHFDESTKAPPPDMNDSLASVGANVVANLSPTSLMHASTKHEDDSDSEDVSHSDDEMTPPAVVAEQAAVAEVTATAASATLQTQNFDGGEQAAQFIRKEQDLDWRPPGKSKSDKLTATMERIAYRLHSVTLHSFHDHIYSPPDPDSVYFSGNKHMGKHDEKHDEEETGHKKKLDRKLNKLLGIKEYSSSRPLISRVGLLVEPMIGSVFGFLSFFRAMHNIGTWQDPYLTFWMHMLIGLLGAALFFIPWRPVLFLFGLWFVGPQNWVIRKLREGGILPPKKPRVRKDDNNEDNQDHQIFHSHRRIDGITEPKPPPEVSENEMQRIVVPYGHLMYQRFYDFPPEQQYATVTPVEHPSGNRDVAAFSGTQGNTSSHHKSLGRFRKVRRFFGRANTRDGSCELPKVAESPEKPHSHKKGGGNGLPPNEKSRLLHV